MLALDFEIPMSVESHTHHHPYFRLHPHSMNVCTDCWNTERKLSVARPPPPLLPSFRPVPELALFLVLSAPHSPASHHRFRFVVPIGLGSFPTHPFGTTLGPSTPSPPTTARLQYTRFVECQGLSARTKAETAFIRAIHFHTD